MYKQLDLFSMMTEEPKEPEKKAPEEAAVQTDESLQTAITSVVEEVNVAAVKVEEADALVLAPPKTVRVFVSEPKTVAQQPVKKKRGRKSLKEMEAEASSISVPPDEILFRKQYYSIGEVASMFSLNTSLLRYWETEFDILKPRKNRKGDRHFRPEDIKNLVLIHHLLRQRKYTIEGAKDYLKKNKQKAQENFKLIQKLQNIKTFLLELKAGL